MKKYGFLLFIITVILASCKKSGDIQCIPFQESKGDAWGMVGTDGKLLFSKQFEECPTVVINDRFFAKNNNGNWELYKADASPMLISAKEFEQAGAFREKVTPVVIKGKKAIDFIDTKGEVVFSLASAAGSDAKICSNFFEGISIFKKGDNYGAINTKGDVVIAPDYCALMMPSDGKVLAVHKRYANELSDKKFNVDVLTVSGEKLFDLSVRKFSNIASNFVDGALWVQTTSGKTVSTGIVNDKGDFLLAPTSKVKGISDMRNGKVIYFDGKHYGLMTYEGEILLRAKFKALAFAGKGNDLLFAMEDRDDAKCMIVNEQGEEISKTEYEDVSPFYGPCALLKESSNSYVFVGLDGKELTTPFAVANARLNYGDDFISIDDSHSSFGLAGIEEKETTASKDDSNSAPEPTPAPAPVQPAPAPVQQGPAPQDNSNMQVGIDAYRNGYFEFNGTLNVDKVYFALYNDNSGQCNGTFYNYKINVTMQVAGTVEPAGFYLQSTDQKSTWIFKAHHVSGNHYRGTASNGSVKYDMDLYL